MNLAQDHRQQTSEPRAYRAWAAGMESWGKEEAGGGGNGAPGGRVHHSRGLYSKGIALQMATTLAMCGPARKTQVGIWVSTVIPAASGHTVDASLTALVLASNPSQVPKNLASLYLRPLRKYNKGT